MYDVDDCCCYCYGTRMSMDMMGIFVVVCYEGCVVIMSSLFVGLLSFLLYAYLIYFSIFCFVFVCYISA